VTLLVFDDVDDDSEFVTDDVDCELDSLDEDELLTELVEEDDFEDDSEDDIDDELDSVRDELLLFDCVDDDSDDVDGTVNPFVRSCDCTVRTVQNIRRTVLESKALL